MSAGATQNLEFAMRTAVAAKRGLRRIRHLSRRHVHVIEAEPLEERRQGRT
jgi:hypothetical protein